MEQGKRPAPLNFASATTPGGGFLIGAKAQEESLCRASGPIACLFANPIYAFHEKRSDTLYTDYVIHSPDVPVFREAGGRLLEEPWPCTFLTSPAPFATRHLLMQPDGARDLEPTFRSRIAKVLAVAAPHGHEALEGDLRRRGPLRFPAGGQQGCLTPSSEVPRGRATKVPDPVLSLGGTVILPA